MERTGLFRLVFYNYKHLAEEDNADSLQKSLLHYFSSLLKENKCDLHTADEIFVSNSGAYCIFEMFLGLSKIPYTLVEFSQNEFVDRRLINSIGQYKELSLAYCNLVKALGTVVGDNSYCYKRIYCIDSDVDEGLPGRTDCFNSSSLNSISEDDKKKIMMAYPEMSCEKFRCISVLLVPNSESLTRRALKNCGGYITDVVAPYTLLIDILKIKSEQLMIKPHPHGSFSFETMFPDSILLDKTFPLEFLHLFPDCRIYKMVSVETSAIDKVKSLVTYNLTASRYYMLRFEEILQMYTTVLLRDSLSFYKLYYFSPITEGTQELNKLFSECYEGGFFTVENKVFPLGESEIVATISPKHAKLFGSYIHKFAIIRKPINKSAVLSEGRSYIYMVGDISKDECNKVKLAYTLKNSGIKVTLCYEGMYKYD